MTLLSRGWFRPVKRMLLCNRYEALLIRPGEVSIPVRAGPVEASTLRQAQGERTSYFIGPEQ